MSDVFYRLIPLEVGVIPEKVNESLILDILKNYDIDSECVRINSTPNIEFIDCGGNLESIKCNHCGTDLSEVWGDLMDQAFTTKFKDRSIRLNCCGTESTLDALSYHFDVGFSRFVIEVMNPSKSIDNRIVDEVGEVIGLDLKCIIAHL